MQLSVLSSKIALAEKKATEQYARLLSNHPKNVSVLRDYAKFLDEVILDERAAYEISFSFFLSLLLFCFSAL